MNPDTLIARINGLEHRLDEAMERIAELESEQEDRDSRLVKKMDRLGLGTSQGVRISPLPGLEDMEGLTPGRVSAAPQPRGERITYQGQTFEVTGIDGDSPHGITAFRVREPGPRKDGGGEHRTVVGSRREWETLREAIMDDFNQTLAASPTPDWHYGPAVADTLHKILTRRLGLVG